ncbi:hypothetical protein G6F50_017398 [Rhizopus delemar]|uniref:Cytochrome c-type biogenesis protein CcmF C-terminal domain-containing protein n=1 Tax=Rhizopus delemar TaxID=936053 RepID=A0A9P7C0M4_9FUNG|nr:hypothetical protein G6F50_017398 [Rhizopus delemar]
MTEAGIDARFDGDVYVALGEPLGNNAWAVRVHIKPFVRWIWLGALLMALGGFITAADRRFRRPHRDRRAVLLRPARADDLRGDEIGRSAARRAALGPDRQAGAGVCAAGAA